MSQPIPREVSFTGVRVTLDSHKSFDDLAAALLDDVGDKPASLSDYVSTSADWDQYQEQIQSRVGPSGFMLFKLFDHTDWINIAGIHRKLLRAIIGNPWPETKYCDTIKPGAHHHFLGRWESCQVVR